jgi:hypothetical protein
MRESDCSALSPSSLAELEETIIRITTIKIIKRAITDIAIISSFSLN